MKASTLTALSWPQPRARPQRRQRGGTVSDHTVSTKADNKAGNADESGSILVGERNMRGDTNFANAAGNPFISAAQPYIIIQLLGG